MKKLIKTRLLLKLTFVFICSQAFTDGLMMSGLVNYFEKPMLF